MTKGSFSRSVQSLQDKKISLQCARLYVIFVVSNSNKMILLVGLRFQCPSFEKKVYKTQKTLT